MEIKLVSSIEDSMRQEWAHAERLLKRKTKLPIRPIRKLIMTPELFAKVFSPERITLMLAVQRAPETNIYQLAKQLNRKYEAVHRDVKFLLSLSILKSRVEQRACMLRFNGPIIIPALAAG